MEPSSSKKLKDSDGLPIPVGVGDDLRLEYENVFVDGSNDAEIGDGNYRADGEQIQDIDMAVDSSTIGNSNEYDTALVNFAGPVFSPEDERRLKRERRKEANRESARKSRMKKQNEFEDLTQTWDSLKMENSSLKSELERLYSDSENLRQENSVLKAKLGISESREGEMVSSSIGAEMALSKDIEKIPEDSDNLNAGLSFVRNENADSVSNNDQFLDS